MGYLPASIVNDGRAELRYALHNPLRTCADAQVAPVWIVDAVAEAGEGADRTELAQAEPADVLNAILNEGLNEMEKRTVGAQSDRIDLNANLNRDRGRGC